MIQKNEKTLDKLCTPLGPPILDAQEYYDLSLAVEQRAFKKIKDLFSAGGNICKLLEAAISIIDETAGRELSVLEQRWQAGAVPGKTREMRRASSGDEDIFYDEFAALLEHFADLIHDNVTLGPKGCGRLWQEICFYYGDNYEATHTQGMLPLASWVHGYWYVEQASRHMAVSSDTFLGTGLPPVPPAI